MADRAAPQTEHDDLRLSPLEQAQAQVRCECSVLSLEAAYLKAAASQGIRLQEFDKDFSAFESAKAAFAIGSVSSAPLAACERPDELLIDETAAAAQEHAASGLSPLKAAALCREPVGQQLDEKPLVLAAPKRLWEKRCASKLCLRCASAIPNTP